MPNYCVRWPNGDFSVVYAQNKSDAAFYLDEVGSCGPEDMHLLPDFMAHFTLEKDGELELEGFGEVVRDTIREKYYPLLDEFMLERFDTEGFEEELPGIIQQERDRLDGDEKDFSPFEREKERAAVEAALVAAKRLHRQASSSVT